MANEFKDVIRIWNAKAADALKNQILVKQFGATTDTFEVAAKDPSGNMMYLPSDKTPLVTFVDLSVTAWNANEILYGDGDQSTDFVFISNKIGNGTSNPFISVSISGADFTGNGYHVKNTSNPSYLILESDGNAANGTEAGFGAGRIVFGGNNGATANQKLMQITGGGNTIAFDGLDDTGAISQADLFQVNRNGVFVGSPMSFTGANGKIQRSVFSPNSITLNNGTSSDSVSDLQTPHDTNFYELTEASGAPGQNLEIHFTNVDHFHKVEAYATYNGSSSHVVAVQLYNRVTAQWDKYHACQNGQEYTTGTADETALENKGFDIVDDTPYIGTGGDAGKVDARFYHPQSGTGGSHKLWIGAVRLIK